MDISDWKVLELIHSEKSLSKAAEKLFTSQPSISYKIKKLEDEFDVKILKRTSIGVKFTPEGEYIYKSMEEMHEKLNSLKRYVKQMSQPISGRLSIGVSRIYAKYSLAPILKEFMLRFPGVELDIVTGSSSYEIMTLMEEGKLDLSIIRGDFEWNGGEITISEEPYGIICLNLESISKINNGVWIQYSNPRKIFSVKYFTCWWNQHFDAPIPQKKLVIDSVEACIQLVKQGLGFTVLPEIHAIRHSDLFFYPIQNEKGVIFTQKTRMIYQADSQNIEQIKAFEDIVLYFENH